MPTSNPSASTAVLRQDLALLRQQARRRRRHRLNGQPALPARGLAARGLAARGLEGRSSTLNPRPLCTSSPVPVPVPTSVGYRMKGCGKTHVYMTRQVRVRVRPPSPEVRRISGESSACAGEIWWCLGGRGSLGASLVCTPDLRVRCALSWIRSKRPLTTPWR